MRRLKAEAKARGAVGARPPGEIGGGGLPFMDFVYLNEIIGRSRVRPGRGRHRRRCRTRSCSTSTPATSSASASSRRSSPATSTRRSASPSPRSPAATRRRCRRRPTSTATSGSSTATSGSRRGASRAAFTTVFAKTEPDAEKHMQFSSIIVPTDTPGYLIQRAVPTMGHVGGQHCEVVYDNVRVPAANLLGNRGEGFLISQKRLGPGRIFHCMRWLGQAQRAFELMCDARPEPLRPRLAAGREGRDPDDDRRVGGRDPGRPADDARRRPGDGLRARGARRDQPDQVPRRARCCTT